MNPSRPTHPRGATPNRPGLLLAALAGFFTTSAFGWTATGTVKTSSGTPLAGVAVSVKDSAAKLSTTTDASGAFTINAPTGVGAPANRSGFTVQRVGNDLLIERQGDGIVEVTLHDLGGVCFWKTSATLSGGQARIAVPTSLDVKAGVLRVRYGSEVLTQMTILQGAREWRLAPMVLARSAATSFPTLVFKKAGYRDTSFVMTSESQSAVAMVMKDTVPSTSGSDFVEDHRSECVIPTLPAVSALTANSFLPDPFTMLDGTKVTTKAQWKCRREEIAAMLEKYIHGEKPRKPEKVTGSFSGNKLTVSVTDKGKTVSFSVTITKPAGAGPFPAIIGWDGGNIGGYSSLPVAKISYPIGTLASEGSGRGKGVFYDLYGSNASASELMAHAWGLSRIIDALLVTPAAGIDAKHLAVTGCSRWGKSSTVAGSFDQRVQLVIPQEPGSGGVAAWRIIPSFPDAQPISSTANEAYWTRADFLGNFGSAITKLPVDHHQMVGMIAPRGLLVLDNSIGWLGPQVGYGTSIAAKEIFTALGAAESITYSSVGGHTHCAQPASQDHWVASYVKKFLLGGTGEAAKIEAPADYKFDRAKWINWSTPTLN